MVISRRKRTSLFRQQVEEEWSEYFWEFVLKFSDKLDWNGISWNPNITMEFIEKYSDKPWDWNGGISRNPNITMEFIEKYSNKPWNWYYISYNQNITIEFIEKYPDKSWNWGWISYNPFNYEKELFIEKRMKEYLMCYRIQLYYWKGLWNPSCQIGYNKISRNYNACFNKDGRVKFNSDFR